MKKIINNIEDITAQMVSGFVKTNAQRVKQLPQTCAVVRTDEEFTAVPHVGIVSGGGSGHEPLHLGFIGAGMLSAAVAGQVNTSPTPDQIYKAIKAADQGQGVLLIVKNYAGDVMNFEIAQELAEFDDHRVKTVVVADDISVEDSAETQGKRGVAGTVFVEKICGAAAQNGMDLDSLAKLGQSVVENTKTIGLALSAATVPAVGHPGFELQDDELEYGVGIHNERGYATEKLAPSKEMATELVEKISKSFNTTTGKYAVLVNGLGATPLMEQYIFANDVLNKLADKKIDVAFSKVGSFVTAIDMHGISLTITKLADGWEEYLRQETQAIAW